MSNSEQRQWYFYIDDMINFAERALEYTANINQAIFIADAMRYDATLRNLELIGEAATHIPSSIRDTHMHIPWRLIIATRNRLIHAYLGIDNDTLWSIIQDDLPLLLNQLRALRATLTDQQNR
ncbi:MAG: DUF86 domain-containing protein [Roseiflexaceae bacterium]